MDIGATRNEGKGLVGHLAKHRGDEGVLIPLDQYVQEGQLILLLYVNCEL